MKTEEGRETIGQNQSYGDFWLPCPFTGAEGQACAVHFVS